MTLPSSPEDPLTGISLKGDPLPFEAGDHLFVECGGYSHHGIYMGQGQVIHFDSTVGRKLLGTLNGAPPRICEIPIEEFAGKKTLHTRTYHENALPTKQSLERARSRLGERGYHLFENNCEHFAVWCKTGHGKSTQIDAAKKAARFGAAGMAIGSAVIRSASVLPGPYRLVAYGAGAVLAVGSTTCSYLLHRRKNRDHQLS